MAHEYYTEEHTLVLHTRTTQKKLGADIIIPLDELPPYRITEQVGLCAQPRVSVLCTSVCPHRLEGEG
jgi:hypothetical protein